MVRVRIEDLIHAHGVFAEVRASVVQAEVIRLEEPFLHRGVAVARPAHFSEGRGQFELSVEAYLVSQGIRAKHVVRVDQRAVISQDLRFGKANIISRKHVINSFGVELLLRVSSRAHHAKVVGTLSVVGDVIHGQLIKVIQPDPVVVLLGVDALLVRDRINAAALPEAIAGADIRDVLQDAVDCSLIRVTVVVSLHCQVTTVYGGGSIRAIVVGTVTCRLLTGLFVADLLLLPEEHGSRAEGRRLAGFGVVVRKDGLTQVDVDDDVSRFVQKIEIDVL